MIHTVTAAASKHNKQKQACGWSNLILFIVVVQKQICILYWIKTNRTAARLKMKFKSHKSISTLLNRILFNRKKKRFISVSRYFRNQLFSLSDEPKKKIAKKLKNGKNVTCSLTTYERPHTHISCRPVDIRRATIEKNVEYSLIISFDSSEKISATQFQFD